MSIDVSSDLRAALVAAAVLAAAAVLGLLAGRLIVHGAARAARNGGAEPDSRLRRPVLLLVPALACLLALPAAGLPADALGLVRRLFSLLLIGATGWLAFGLLGLAADLAQRRYSIDHADNLEQREMQTRIAVFRRIGAVLIVFITATVMMMTIPSIRHLGVSLFASAGVAGIVIGLAARPTISNLIAGIQIALTQPIRVDDVVIVEGEWGWIEEITTTYVVVRIWDQRRLIVPLTNFIEKPFQNWTRQTADILGSVYIHADYRVPVEDVRAELERIVKPSKYWDGRVCVLHVTDATDRAVQLRALVSARNSPDAWELRCLVRERLLDWLQRTHPGSLPRIRAETESGGEGIPAAA